MPESVLISRRVRVAFQTGTTSRLATAAADRDLMSEVIAGSVEAFGEIYDRYCARAYGVARAVGLDHGRAQDAVQEGFLSVWKSRATYRTDQGTVAAWVLTVVRYRAIDIARRHSKHASERPRDDQPDLRSSAHDPVEIAIRRDDAQRLQESLAMLPETQAEVITLAYYGQLSHIEIAAQLGLPPGTVKGRMRLGLQKLREHIAPLRSDISEIAT